MSDELFKQEGYDLMADAFEVYNKMGSGFLEDVSCALVVTHHVCL
jgi:hypothetical protein